MPEVYALSEWTADDSGTRQVAIVDDYPTPFGWSDATGQADADILDGYDLCVVIGRISDAQWTALQADARYPALVASGTLTGEQVDALRSELAAVVHPDVAKLVTQEADAGAVVTALVDANRRPVWRAGMSVKAGDVLYYERNLIEVLADHETASHWKPGEAHSLYKRYFNPDAEPEPWVQPISAETAYPLGFRVLHNGFTWESLVASNSWEPGAQGSEALWRNLTPPPPTSAWAFPVAYKIGDRVTYQGSTYECRQAHTSQAGWTPVAVPALWLLV